MFFDNQTGEHKYDYLRKALADMLITDLSQSRYLRVMTLESMFHLLKSSGFEDVDIIEASMGFELCKSAGTQVMVLGSLMKSGNTFVLNAQVLDVDTKELIAPPYRVTGKGESSILGNLVDDLTDKIKKGLEISIREIQEEKTAITELRTTSLKAYEYYFAGKEAAYRMDHQEAIDNFEKAVALDSTFIEAYERLARQYHETRENSKALEILEKVKSFSPELSEQKLVEILALEAYIKQDWDLAISYWKRLITMNPEDIRAHIDLGVVYYRWKMMYDEGISQFKKVLELDPQGVTHRISFTYNVLGWAYLRKWELKNAQAAFEKYVALLPNQANPLICLGEFHLIAGNYDQAAASLLLSLEIEPDLALAHGDLGDVYMAKGMYEQALRSYGRCLAFSTSKVDQAAGHFLLGKLRYFTSDYPEAIEDCRQALELNPSMIQAHWILGLSLLEKEMFDQAESEALTIRGLIEETKTEELKAHYYHLLGELFLRRDLRQQALENFSRAADVKSLDRTFFVNALGGAYFRVGELDGAIEALESVLVMNPNYAQAHYLLGLAYEKKGRKAETRRHFEQLVRVWRDADANLPQLVEARKRLEES
jgi:tetratricopeptide (TPR) repeat protein